MSTLKPSTTEITLRALLIAVMLSNALIPTAAAAWSQDKAGATDSSPASVTNSEEMMGSTGKAPLRLHSRVTLQDTTPSVSTTNTETPTPELTPTPTNEATPTPPEAIEATATLEATPTPTLIQNASETVLPTQTSTANGQPPALSFDFSVTPEQAAPGDDVTFTIEVSNEGQTAVTGLLFSNVIPQAFGTGQSGFREAKRLA